MPPGAAEFRLTWGSYAEILRQLKRALIAEILRPQEDEVLSAGGQTSVRFGTILFRPRAFSRGPVATAYSSGAQVGCADQEELISVRLTKGVGDVPDPRRQVRCGFHI